MGLVNNLCTEGCPHSIFSFWSRSFFLQTWNLNIVLTGYAMCAAKSILYRTTDSFRSMVGAWFRNEESTGTASYCPAGIYFFLIPQLIHFRIVLWLASMNWLEGSLTSLEICHLCHPNFLSCMEEPWWNLPRLLCRWAGSSEPVAQIPSTRTFGLVSGYGHINKRRSLQSQSEHTAHRPQCYGSRWQVHCCRRFLPDAGVILKRWRFIDALGR
jgi:hypothetical protein